jgi:ParB-like chromosome segregation protein Spo0J
LPPGKHTSRVSVVRLPLVFVLSGGYFIIMTIKTSEVIFREDLYPRIEPNAKLIQQYAENIENLPPIEINQHNILIDGYHRWTAHKKAEKETIEVIVIQTASDNDLLALSIEKNATHGMQLSTEDKKKMAVRLYNAGTGKDKAEICRILSISNSTVTSYLTDIDKQLREERKSKIFSMYLAGYTNKEIAEITGLSEKSIYEQTTYLLTELEKSKQLLANFQDSEFETPIYNVWTFAKKTNNVSHPGNSEVRIVENLLYLYTVPFDIVLDPFAGGGSTIDICKKRLRRYWVADRKPIVEREKEIRKLDIVTELPDFNNRWKDVRLVYLDPPYWKQLENQYSTDAEDLANMPLDKFNDALSSVINNIAKKLSHGSHIALLIQPTQWKSDNKEFTDHVSDMIRIADKRLKLVNRVSCPYSTQQCTPQQVEYAKENKMLLVISRELIIWEIS